MLETGQTILTHHYVVLEAMALIQHRLGLTAALKFAADSDAFEIDWVDRATHQAAVRQLARRGKRAVSLVDEVSFLVMRRRNVDSALAFDDDFEREGFTIFGVR